MAVETGDYISDLVPTAPNGADPVAQGDDHLRLIKKVLQGTFNGLIGPLMTKLKGSLRVPVGLTADRDSPTELGLFRYNSEDGQFEGFTANGWGSVGGGQMLGKAAVKAIFFNNTNVAENVTLKTGTNGLSAGPVVVDNGFAVTAENGAVWSIV